VRLINYRFVVLSVIFVILGGTLFSEFKSTHQDVVVVVYAISLFLLNLSPNTIEFMLPAELFPTRYRGTCCVNAVASGNFGAIIIQIVFWVVYVAGLKRDLLAILLLLFAALMLLAAVAAWVWIPEVQESVDYTAVEVRGYFTFTIIPLE
jgi:PHS family inorganic phosphate transporter-like MFS transporter